MMWLLLAAGAFAEMPLPDYERSLATAEWHALNNRIEANCEFVPVRGAVVCRNPDEVDVVITDAERWMSVVSEDAGIIYLVGLCWRYKGEDAKAQSHWERATRSDPDYRAPWYDLGEIYLANQSLDKARVAFEHVTRLSPDGPTAWIGPWRLAEVAAAQQRPDDFEAHMRTALQHGFTFERIQGTPNWKAYLADPVMHDSVQQLITVYGSQTVLDSLR
ncbi:MAG: hypothetical protein GWP91_02620 [Rhodobacterales bacterium]|nr:hypothetical protein [Rhodobacterales bacterium]